VTGRGLGIAELPPLTDLPPRPMSPPNIMGHEALEARHCRKKAETDLQLLTNRIAILKAEESKALHKVQETKVRAQEIME
jgi:hypothetical protein